MNREILVSFAWHEVALWRNTQIPKVNLFVILNHIFYTGLFKMIVAVLTTYPKQYTSDSSLCVIYLIEQHSKILLITLQVFYMCTLCDSTNINTIIEFVPHVSGDGFNGSSDSYLQFRTLSLEIVHTSLELNCQTVVVSRIWCGIAAGHLHPENHFR